MGKDKKAATTKPGGNGDNCPISKFGCQLLMGLGSSTASSSEKSLFDYLNFGRTSGEIIVFVLACLVFANSMHGQLMYDDEGLWKYHSFSCLLFHAS
jgi:hypothetical protein